MDELNKKLDEIVSRLGELYDTQLEQVHRYYFLDSESDDYDNIQNLMHDPKIVYDNYSLNLSEILIETGYKIISNISHYIFYSLASLTVFMKQGEGEIELEGLDLAIGSDVIVNLNKNLDLGVSITDDIFDSLTKSEMILSKNHESVPHYVSYLVDQGYSKNLLKNDDVLTKVSVSYINNMDEPEKNQFRLDELLIGYKNKMLEDFDKLQNVIPRNYQGFLN